MQCTNSEQVLALGTPAALPCHNIGRQMETRHNIQQRQGIYGRAISSQYTALARRLKRALGARRSRHRTSTLHIWPKRMYVERIDIPGREITVRDHLTREKYRRPSPNKPHVLWESLKRFARRLSATQRLYRERPTCASTASPAST